MGVLLTKLAILVAVIVAIGLIAEYFSKEKEVPRDDEWDYSELVIASYLSIYMNTSSEVLVERLISILDRERYDVIIKIASINLYNITHEYTPLEGETYAEVRRASKWKSEEMVVEAVREITGEDAEWLYDDEHYFVRLK